MLTKNNWMDYPTLHNALNCEIKDAQGLNDFQQLPAETPIAIPKVGITNFRFPLNLRYPSGELRSHDATASMCVDLAAGKNGINMGRLVSILQRESDTQAFDFQLIDKVLAAYQLEMQDDFAPGPEQDGPAIDEEKKHLHQAQITVKFNYVDRKSSLKSNNWGWQYYPVSLEGRRSPQQTSTEFFLGLDYEYSSTCPCSLSMARQYEREFAQGLTTDGIGVAVPHSQRSKLRCQIKINPLHPHPFFIHDLLLILRQAVPTETQPLAKRIDEQAFAVLNGTYPMFVEHVARNLYQTLNAETAIADWMVQIEHFESLHGHNAAAVIHKGLAGRHYPDQLF